MNKLHYENSEQKLHYTDIMYMMHKKVQDYQHLLNEYNKPIRKGLITLRPCQACGEYKHKEIVHKAQDGRYMCDQCYQSTLAVVTEISDMLDKLNKEESDS